MPRLVSHDVEGIELLPFIKVACSKYGTFAIDSKGTPYSFGKGFLGHNGETADAQPKAIETDRRIFTDVFASSDSVLFYAPIRVFAIEPKCGPSKGGTQVKITGTGFLDSDKMRVRFSAGQHSQEVDCSFQKDGCLIATTPIFDTEGDQNIQLPCDANISVTMDGTNYSECEEQFKIYSNDNYLTSVNPKCGSVAGGTEITMAIEIDS